jgi:REP element-mobilizing transposase RayT
MLPGESYHLFNHANGKENLFLEQKNYSFFLEKLAQYILPISKIFSYCLMPNHFHLVLQIRHEEELLALWQKSKDAVTFTQKQLELKTSKAFGNLFSSYTQAYNKVYNRRGSLFIPSMKTEQIGDVNHFCRVVHYTHANPVHHGFTKTIEEWPHSSYKLFLSDSPTKLDRHYVLNMFGSKAAFIKYHEQPVDIKLKYLE